MSEQSDGQGQRSALKTELGNTIMSDAVVSQVAGIAAQEVEGVQMGGGAADAGRAARAAEGSPRARTAGLGISQVSIRLDPSRAKEETMDLSSLGDMQQYLEGIDFPAGKEEVASGAESNGAPQDFVDQIRNAATERFNSPEEVLQAVQG